MEYPKDYSCLMQPVSDRTGSEPFTPSRGGPWHLETTAISEANKAGWKVLNFRSAETLSCHRAKACVDVHKFSNKRPRVFKFHVISLWMCDEVLSASTNIPFKVFSNNCGFASLSLSLFLKSIFVY